MLEFLKNGAQKKFIVIKIEDLIKYVNSVFKLAMLENDLNDIRDGRKADGKNPEPEYLIVNTDEPYAPDIINLLKNNGHWPGFENMGHQRPEIVCLCGSTRFYDAFQKANYELTMQGKIVLTVGFYPHSQEQAHGQTVGCTPEQKESLDELHKRKIDLCDSVLVLNVGGNIGDSTRSEIEYAERIGKPVKYLEPVITKEYVEQCRESIKKKKENCFA